MSEKIFKKPFKRRYAQLLILGLFVCIVGNVETVENGKPK